MIDLTTLKIYEKQALIDNLYCRNETLDDLEFLENERESVIAWSSKFVYISYEGEFDEFLMVSAKRNYND